MECKYWYQYLPKAQLVQHLSSNDHNEPKNNNCPDVGIKQIIDIRVPIGEHHQNHHSGSKPDKKSMKYLFFL
jgi:hypothetical protein